MQEKVKFHDIADWENYIGDAWIHAHDNILVADDPDTGECIGEFEGEAGWVFVK